MEELRLKVINTAAYIAQQEMDKSGGNLKEVLSKAIDEACLRHDVDRKQFIKEQNSIAQISSSRDEKSLK